MKRCLDGFYSADLRVWRCQTSQASAGIKIGTVIGLMNDPASITEHRSGVGLGNYGVVGYDPDVVPPAGSRVWLTIERLGD